jgi:8-oxo-dGTP diphosphatase
MRREVREEAGIECLDLSLRGTINWPGFGKRGGDWFGFLFVVTRFIGAPLERNPEGALEWVDFCRTCSTPTRIQGVMPVPRRALSWTYRRI